MGEAVQLRPWLGVLPNQLNRSLGVLAYGGEREEFSAQYTRSLSRKSKGGVQLDYFLARKSLQTCKPKNRMTKHREISMAALGFDFTFSHPQNGLAARGSSAAFWAQLKPRFRTGRTNRDIPVKHVRAA
jgi:hypothetical protein